MLKRMWPSHLSQSSPPIKHMISGDLVYKVPKFQSPVIASGGPAHACLVPRDAAVAKMLKNATQGIYVQGWKNGMWIPGPSGGQWDAGEMRV